MIVSVFLFLLLSTCRLITEPMKLLLKSRPELHGEEAQRKPKLLSTFSRSEKRKNARYDHVTNPAPPTTCIAKLPDPVTPDARVELDGDDPSIRTVPLTIRGEITRNLPTLKKNYEIEVSLFEGYQEECKQFLQLTAPRQ